MISIWCFYICIANLMLIYLLVFSVPSMHRTMEPTMMTDYPTNFPTTYFPYVHPCLFVHESHGPLGAPWAPWAPWDPWAPWAHWTPWTQAEHFRLTAERLLDAPEYRLCRRFPSWDSYRVCLPPPLLYVIYIYIYGFIYIYIYIYTRIPLLSNGVGLSEKVLHVGIGKKYLC